jgi:hypothetical protein
VCKAQLFKTHISINLELTIHFHKNQITLKLVIDVEKYREYKYENKNLTPTKNPYQQKKILSPKLVKTVFGRILNEEFPNPISDKEKEAYENSMTYVSGLKDKKDLKFYISRFFIEEIPIKFTKPELVEIALKIKYKDEISFQGRDFLKKK